MKIALASLCVLLCCPVSSWAQLQLDAGQSYSFQFSPQMFNLGFSGDPTPFSTVQLNFSGFDPADSLRFLCMIGTVYCANKFAQQQPRLFTVLALFALSWAILLPYYEPPNKTAKLDFLPSLCGFAQVYCGVLLLREARVRGVNPDPQRVPVPRGDRWALSLLILLAAPGIASNTLPLLKLTSENIDQLKLTFAIALDTLGFFYLFWGLRKLLPGIAVSLTTGAVGLIYAGAEWHYLIDKLRGVIGKDMPHDYMVFFAACKLIWSAIVLFWIIWYICGDRESSRTGHSPVRHPIG